MIERQRDMISGTTGQEVGVYCDASEKCATQGGAAGLAEGNRELGARHQRERATEKGTRRAEL